MDTLAAFQALDIRTGTIVAVEDVPGAKKPIYKMTVDLGPLGKKITGAGLKKYYAKDELVGKRVVAVVNLPPKQIAQVTSECLLLAALDEEKNQCVLLVPEKEVANGLRIF